MQIIFVFILLIIHFPLLAITFGSDTTPTRFNNQIELSDGDRIAGFAAIAGGFKLLEASTDATWDSFFRASGNFELNSGTLTLNRDLILQDVSTIISIGDIVGNGHVLNIAPSVKSIPSSSSFVLDFSVTTSDFPSSVDSIDFNVDTTCLVGGVNASVPNVVKSYTFDDPTLVLADEFDLPLTNVGVTCVRCHPSDQFVALTRLDTGSFELFTYTINSDCTLTLIDNEFAGLGNNANSCAWRPDGDFIAMGTGGGVQELRMFSFDGVSTAQIAAIGLGADAQVQALSWDSTGQYVAIGLAANGSTEFRVYEFDDTGPTLTLNASVEIGTAVLAVSWNKGSNNLIAIGLDGVTAAGRLRLYSHDGGAGTLTLEDSLNDIDDPVLVLHWNSECYLALGKENGTGPDVRFYEVRQDPIELIQQSDSSSSFDMGGDVQGIRWSRDDAWVAATSSDNSLIRIYGMTLPTCGFEDRCFTFSDLEVFLNCNLCVQDGCITFTGNSLINGQGNCLTLKSTTTIIVGENSTLLLKNMTIKGLEENRIHGTDATSTFSFKNVELVLDDDFSFTVSKFAVLSDLTILGDGKTFNYQTDQVSTVSTCGRLILENGVTFNYNPSSGLSNLLQFEDSTSHFLLNSATLEATDALSLQKGQVFVDGKSTICAQGTPGEVVFGDGASVANNMCLRMLPAANLIIAKGTLVHNNVE